MRRIQALFVLILVLPGCYAATKATVDIASAQQQGLHAIAAPIRPVQLACRYTRSGSTGR